MIGGLLFYFTDGFDFIINFVFGVGVWVVVGGFDVEDWDGFMP
jgi:hypothetical protein